MRRRRSKAKELPVHDWRTSDAEEIQRRKERARAERFRINNLTPDHRVFSNFSVASPSKAVYQVELRGPNHGDCACTCVDFRSNGLGTCKHVEAVRDFAGRRSLLRAWESGQRRWDILPDRATNALRLEGPADRPVPAALRRWFATGSTFVAEDPQTLVERLTRDTLPADPQIRLSQEVAPWLESRQRAAERTALRHEYELKVQSGEWPPHETRSPLFPYQREGMLHLAFTERALLADEMGLGKTIQAIAACALLRRLGKAHRVLVVTPASLKAEWEEQIQRFVDLPCHLVFGSHHLRLQWLRRCAADPASVPYFSVMNYEQVLPCVTEINELLRPDVVVLDEAQRIKNWNTKTARTIKRLQSRYAFVLTGTPIENRIDELRSLVDFLDPARLGPLFRFNREFYEFDDRGRPTACKNLDRLHERVKPILLRRRKMEVETQLPPRTDHQRLVPLSDSQRRAYATHEQEVLKLINITERRPLTEQEQTRLQIELSMMRMICDTNYILDPEDRTCPKLAELRAILEECAANQSKAIVFSEWQGMLELVRDLCTELHLDFAWHTGSVPQKDRRADIQRFKNDPECRVFLSTDAGASGLNLQVASVVINCDLPWNPARLEQRIARAWRKHQTRSVTVFNLISQDSIEHRMLDTLDLKRSIAQGVLDPDPENPTTRIALRRDRAEIALRLRQLMGPASASDPTASSTQSQPARRDPVVDLLAAARRVSDTRVLHCEERTLPNQTQPVILLVADRVTEELRRAVEAPPAPTGSGSSTSPVPPPRVELLDHATHAAIQRLIEAGLLQPTHQTLRCLPVDAPLPQPRLTPEQSARLNAHLLNARKRLRLARLLLNEEFHGESRRALHESVLEWRLAVALREGFPPPKNLDAWSGSSDAQAFPEIVAEISHEGDPRPELIAPALDALASHLK